MDDSSKPVNPTRDQTAVDTSELPNAQPNEQPDAQPNQPADQPATDQPNPQNGQVQR